MKKNEPTERQKDIVRRHRRFGDRLRDWMQRREIDAAERRAMQTTATGSRGVDRVPDRRSNPLQRAPRLDGRVVGPQRHRVSKRGNEIRTEVRAGGNHDRRRYFGERGKPRKRRVREMPGAEARRLERARKEWQLAGERSKR